MKYKPDTEVTKDEFFDFIKTYPTPLESHTHRICSPVMISYNDFILYKSWPESMVAKYYYDEQFGKPTQYYLVSKENI